LITTDMSERIFQKREQHLLEEAVRSLDDYIFRRKDINLYKFVVSSIEKPLIEKVLEATDGNQLQAARILGINRNTLHAKIAKLKIDVSKWKEH